MFILRYYSLFYQIASHYVISQQNRATRMFLLKPLLSLEKFPLVTEGTKWCCTSWNTLWLPANLNIPPLGFFTYVCLCFLLPWVETFEYSKKLNFSPYPFLSSLKLRNLLHLFSLLKCNIVFLTIHAVTKSPIQVPTAATFIKFSFLMPMKSVIMYALWKKEHRL